MAGATGGEEPPPRTALVWCQARGPALLWLLRPLFVGGGSSRRAEFLGGLAERLELMDGSVFPAVGDGDDALLVVGAFEGEPTVADGGRMCACEVRQRGPHTPVYAF
jgi:hypothetical protein